jgi:hypothetical protein
MTYVYRQIGWENALSDYTSECVRDKVDIHVYTMVFDAIRRPLVNQIFLEIAVKIRQNICDHELRLSRG